MRALAIGVLAVVFGAAMFATTVAQAGKAGKKNANSEKVELKDLPAAVIDAAKREVPDATFTTAEKRSTKKEGTVYSLQGTQGKYNVSVLLTSSGQMLRLTKHVAGKKQKAVG